jgi:hypothetical protein
MLEGVEDESTGYFVTLEVSASSESEAAQIAIAEMAKNENREHRVEEVELKFEDEGSTESQVHRIYGKSFFPIKD